MFIIFEKRPLWLIACSDQQLIGSYQVELEGNVEDGIWTTCRVQPGKSKLKGSQFVSVP